MNTNNYTNRNMLASTNDHSPSLRKDASIEMRVIAENEIAARASAVPQGSSL